MSDPQLPRVFEMTMIVRLGPEHYGETDWRRSEVDGLREALKSERIRADAAEMREETLVIENELLRKEIRLLEGMEAF